jgi:hypothetical protein
MGVKSAGLYAKEIKLRVNKIAAYAFKKNEGEE